MSAALPSPPTPSPGGHPLPVEALQDVLGGLLHERERLRGGGSAAALEENRQKIVGVAVAARPRADRAPRARSLAPVRRGYPRRVRSGVDRKAMAALSTGHLATDLAQGSLAALLPFLVEKFDLSYAMAAALVLAATISSSIVQPLFGLVSDAKGGYWLLPAGVALAGIGMALAAVAPSYPLVLVAVLVAGLGVAAYHPEASKFASYVSGDRRASGMAFFSVGGNLGFALGPVPRVDGRARPRAERRPPACAPRARRRGPARRGPRSPRALRPRPRPKGRDDGSRGQSARADAAPRR